MAAIRTAPEQISTMPPGVPYIIGNEAAERFSYYGMRGILVVYMTTLFTREFLSAAPAPADAAAAADALKVATEFAKADAKRYYHLFLWAVYFLPFLGALLSDGLLGKYRTIIYLSLVYCAGHVALAVDETRIGLLLGLFLIALGAGGIKPCVSAHVGDQFGEKNKHLVEKVFTIFYFSINFGAVAAQWITPMLLEPSDSLRSLYPAGVEPSQIAFGLPGILMFIATLCFWLGRKKFVHIPPGGKAFLAECFSEEGRAVLKRLSLLVVFLSFFWCLYDQTSSAWILQAQDMDRNIWGYDVLASQVQAVNPLLIMLFIPLFAFVVYPAINRVFPLTPLRKMGIGFFLTSLSFLVSLWIESMIYAGLKPHIIWQIAAFVVITAAETMVSITALDYFYTQAPTKMKSFVMSLNLLAVSFGNLLTVTVDWLMTDPVTGQSRLVGPSMYGLYSGIMLAAAIVFVFVSQRFQEKTYIQGAAE